MPASWQRRWQAVSACPSGSDVEQTPAEAEEELPRAPSQVVNKLLTKEWGRFQRACVQGTLVNLEPFEPLDAEYSEEFIQCASATHNDVLGDDEYRLSVRNRLQTIMLGQEDHGFILKPKKVALGQPFVAACNFNCSRCRRGKWVENSLLLQEVDGGGTIDVSTGEAPAVQCKWCRCMVKGSNIRLFDPCKMGDYSAFGKYWPQPHDPTQCPPCIKKQRWCPKKLCHHEPKNYGDALEELLRRDSSCREVDSRWRAGWNSYLGRNVISKKLSVEFERGVSSEFEVVLSPAVYLIPRALPKVLANLQDPNVRQLRDNRCPDFSEAWWTGSEVLLALNNSFASDDAKTADEKTMVFNRVADQLVDGDRSDAVQLEEGWWRYALNDFSYAKGRTRAFHGTSHESAGNILKVGLKPPGDDVKKQHGQSGSKTGASVYTTPCLSVAAFPTYASLFPVGRGARRPKAWAQIVFEVDVPEKYVKQQPGTLTRHTHWSKDLRFEERFHTNGGLEWLYDDPSDVRLVALLLRGFGAGAELFGSLNAQVVSTKEEKPEYCWTRLLEADYRAKRFFMKGIGRSVQTAYEYDDNGQIVVGSFAMKKGELGESKRSCILCDDPRIGRVAIMLNKKGQPTSAHYTQESFSAVRRGQSLQLDPHACGRMIFRFLGSGAAEHTANGFSVIAKGRPDSSVKGSAGLDRGKGNSKQNGNSLDGRGKLGAEALGEVVAARTAKGKGKGKGQPTGKSKASW